MNTKEQVLQGCTVEGLVVKLPPGQLDRKLYQDVAKALELIGGKWKGGKVMGFVFPTDPTDLLEQIANGDQRNLKKEFQFFATPKDIADKLAELANINDPMLLVLEPSAGQGAIIEALLRKEPKLLVHAYELMDVNRSILESKFSSSDCVILGDDFMEADSITRFNRIVANPPFTKNQDIDHIKRMYSLLRNGGRVVSIASTSWEFGSQKKQVEFRDWLKEVGAEVHALPRGTFKESGTDIETRIIVIDK